MIFNSSHFEGDEGRSSSSFETFRPNNLPPKSPREVKKHIKEVKALESVFCNELQKLAVDSALDEMKKSQRQVSYVSYKFSDAFSPVVSRR